MRDPRTVHDFEQFGAALRDLANTVALYRKDLIAGGVPEVEAWAAAQRIEARYADILFAKIEAKAKTDEQSALERALDLIQEAIDRRTLLTDEELS